MSHRFRTSVIYVALCWVLGCATTADTKALRRIKKVAIIGFAATAKNQDQSLKYILRPSVTSDMLYRVVGARLLQNRKWQVMTPDNLRKNEAYKKLYKRYTSHLLNAGVRSGGILAPIESFNISVKARNKLIKGLGVDAVAAVGFIVEKAELPVALGTDQATVTAKVSFDLYVRSKEDSVWHVANLPTRTQQPLPQFPDVRLQTPEERALAIAVNSAMTAVFELKDGPAKATDPIKQDPAPLASPPPGDQLPPGPEDGVTEPAPDQPAAGPQRAQPARPGKTSPPVPLPRP